VAPPRLPGFCRSSSSEGRKCLRHRILNTSEAAAEAAAAAAAAAAADDDGTVVGGRERERDRPNVGRPSAGPVRSHRACITNVMLCGPARVLALSRERAQNACHTPVAITAAGGSCSSVNFSQGIDRPRSFHGLRGCPPASPSSSPTTSFSPRGFLPPFQRSPSASRSPWRTIMPAEAFSHR
jgi:hypothetical protein